jgi:hypothetical protein
MTDQHLHGLEESLDVGSPQDEPATLASIVLNCMRDRPLAVYLGEGRSLRCVPARALGDIEIDDIVGVYSPKSDLDAIADDIRSYVEARFGPARVPPALTPLRAA